VDQKTLAGQFDASCRPGPWVAAGPKARHSRSLGAPLEPLHGQHHQNMLDDCFHGWRALSALDRLSPRSIPYAAARFVISLRNILFFNRINLYEDPF
jgi:hypothetical protein